MENNGLRVGCGVEFCFPGDADWKLLGLRNMSCGDRSWYWRSDIFLYEFIGAIAQARSLNGLLQHATNPIILGDPLI